MAQEYDPKQIEEKWQKEWEKSGLYKTRESKDKPKFYILDMFPYVSGEGIHVGHPKGYIATDVVSRMKRMQGFNVLHPMGFDSFGLPAENYAIKTKTNPVVAVAQNIERFKKQLEMIGFDYDWSREVVTSDPKFYKWTQWIFLKLLEKGLAYESHEPVNWCPVDKTVLANEDVEDGKCERCGAEVELRPIRQWVLKITDYADRLLEDLDELDWPESIKVQQRNWIGRSEGVLIKFDDIEVFTTRPDTIFGATFIVVSGKEDKFTGRYVTNPATGEKIPVWEAEYVLSDYGTGAIMGVPAHDERDWEFAKKHDLPIRHVVAPRRVDHKNPPQDGKELVFRNAIIAIVKNPKDGKILILKWKKHPWTTFVMGGREDGESSVEAALREIKEETGYKNLKFIKALGGPTHSEFYAAHKGVNRIAHSHALYFELENEEKDEISLEESETHDVLWVPESEIRAENITHIETDILLERMKGEDGPYVGEGVITDSREFSLLTSEEARKIITEKFGKKITKYKLRDWVFSRQRYWGEPIPVLRDGEKVIPLKEEDLPLTLPEVEFYEPTGTEESPLANIPEWINVKVDGKVLRRESNTMPQWAGSSWYYLRFMDPQNDGALVNKEKEKYWNTVDLYVGGAEHATRHLIYARFWHKFLFDIGVVSTKEPFKRLQHVGLIIAEDGRKMSKRWGNIINPDEIIGTFGADSLRMYEMFMGPFDQSVAWNSRSIVGVRRFLEKIWRIKEKITDDSNVSTVAHQTVKKVTEDIESMRFNTAISALMILVNDMEKRESVGKGEYESLLRLIAPFAPHMAEELWSILGNTGSLHTSSWPTYDESKLVADEVSIIVQVDGKMRGKFVAKANLSEEEAVNKAMSLPEVQKWVGDKVVIKQVYVLNKLVNFVIS